MLKYIWKLMKWHIDVPVPESKMFHSGGTFILSGSCFAQEIGQKMVTSGLNALVQPFGTLYQPNAILKTLSNALDQVEPGEEALVQNQGIWYAWDTHGILSDPDPEVLKNRIVCVQEEVREKLLTPGVVIFITFGTALGFVLKDGLRSVANCHKCPASLFETQKEKAENIIVQWKDFISKVNQANPSAEWVFTVSPVRYMRQGNAHFNKAPLFVALDELLKLNNVHYFPAYELLMDELRDYRFYAHDLLHPNDLAIDFIWEKFIQSYASDELRKHIQDHQQFYKLVQHRPIHTLGKDYERFVENLKDKLFEMEERYPNSDFNFVRSQIMKYEHESDH